MRSRDLARCFRACPSGSDEARADARATAPKAPRSRAGVRPISVKGYANFGGARGIRTPDLLIANETRYQLRHSPKCGMIVAPQRPVPATRHPVNRNTAAGLGRRRTGRPRAEQTQATRATQPTPAAPPPRPYLPQAPAARRFSRTASRSMGWNSISSFSTPSVGSLRTLVGRSGTGAEGKDASSRSSSARRGARAASVYVGAGT